MYAGSQGPALRFYVTIIGLARLFLQPPCCAVRPTRNLGCRAESQAFDTSRQGQAGRRHRRISPTNTLGRKVGRLSTLRVSLVGRDSVVFDQAGTLARNVQIGPAGRHTAALRRRSAVLGHIGGCGLFPSVRELKQKYPSRLKAPG